MNEETGNVWDAVFERVARKTGLDVAVIREACKGEIDEDEDEDAK